MNGSGRLAQKGFTMIELLIVVAIIGILAAIAIPAFNDYKAKSHNAAALADLKNFLSIMESHYASEQQYPLL